MSARDRIYVGLGGSAVAIDRATGTELWRTRLKGHDFVSLSLEGGVLVAGCKGEVFGLDPASGSIVWQNNLKGLGIGFVTFAGSSVAGAASAKQRQDAAMAGSTY